MLKREWLEIHVYNCGHSSRRQVQMLLWGHFQGEFPPLPSLSLRVLVPGAGAWQGQWSAEAGRMPIFP